MCSFSRWTCLQHICCSLLSSRAELNPCLLSAREVLTPPCHLLLLQSKMVARISSEAHMLQPTAVGALQVRLCSQ